MCRIAAYEVSSALEKRKIPKALGPSGVVAEIMKAEKEFVIEWLTDLCNDIMAEGKIPSDWKRSVLILNHKKYFQGYQIGS